MEKILGYNNNNKEYNMLDIEKLFRENRKAVRGILYEYEKDWRHMNDLMQDVFLAAVDAAETYDGRSKEVTWLCGIARNVGRMRARELAKYTPPVEFETELGVGDEDVTHYDETLGASDPNDQPELVIETYDLYEKAIASMPPQMAECFHLKVEGYSADEIADKLSTTRDVVYTQISRAKQYLGDLV